MPLNPRRVYPRCFFSKKCQTWTVGLFPWALLTSISRWYVRDRHSSEQCTAARPQPIGWHYVRLLRQSRVCCVVRLRLPGRPVARWGHSGTVSPKLFWRPQILLCPEKFLFNTWQKQKYCPPTNVLRPPNLKTWLRTWCPGVEEEEETLGITSFVLQQPLTPCARGGALFVVQLFIAFTAHISRVFERRPLVDFLGRRRVFEMSRPLISTPALQAVACCAVCAFQRKKNLCLTALREKGGAEPPIRYTQKRFLPCRGHVTGVSSPPE